MKRVLINISNIHSGGALQVAISFISELLALDPPAVLVEIFVSTEVAGAFAPEQLTDSSWNIQIYNTYGLKTIFSRLNFTQMRFDVVFTLFGPKYTWFRSKREIVGFAQPWISSFEGALLESMTAVAISKIKLKYLVQNYFFQKADVLVVELDHVKTSLVRKNIFCESNIIVVPNCIASFYFNESLWKKKNISTSGSEISLGYITRDYAHKNIKILSEVSSILLRKYHFKVKFYFSLTEREWSNYAHEFGDSAVTVGELSVYECPSFYQKMDGIIFPSLLECFSATPLEALVMRKPLFASDRGFVRDVCADHALYFDPLLPESIAKVIFEYFKGTPKTDIELDAAKSHVINFSNAKQRATDYLSII